jgi:hypothetical protein
LYIYPFTLTLQIQHPTLKTQKIQEIDLPAREGAYITGLSLQGARWDAQTGSVERSRPREMFCAMPVMLVRAVAAEKADAQARFMCFVGGEGWLCVCLFFVVVFYCLWMLCVCVYVYLFLLLCVFWGGLYGCMYT